PLFVNEAAVEHGRAAIRHRGRLPAAERLASVDRIQIEAWPPSLERLHGRLADAHRQRGPELRLEDCDQASHLPRRVDREPGDAAVPHAPDRRQLEPVDPSMPYADPLRVEGLGDDHGAPRAQTPHVAQPTDAREAAALLVWRGALLDGPAQGDASSTHGLDGVDRCRQAPFLVGRPASEDAPVAQLAAKRIDAP